MELYPFQIEGVKQILSRQSVLLGDDMGLGKTVQVATAIKQLFDESAIRRVLIISPASLCYNWRFEIQRWANIPSVLYQGSDRYGMLEGGMKILIGSYETIATDLASPTANGSLYRDIGVDLIILDEAQRIKDPESKKSKILTRVLAGRRWAVTGTPLENHPRELASILRFLFPNEFSTDNELNDVARIMSYRDRTLIRRTKSQVGLQIPAKTIAVLPTQLTPDQAAQYETEVAALRESITNSISRNEEGITLLAGLQNLRRIATISDNDESGKIDLLVDEVDAIAELGHKIVIFSSFANLALPLVAKRLSNWGALMYTGSMTTVEREAVHKRFLNDPSAQVMCASLKAAGVGLTWTVATFVYHLDLWWNPQVMNQADDRVHRIGQDSPVLIKRLIAKDTIEEGMLGLLEAKEEVFSFMMENPNELSNRQIDYPQLLTLIGLKGNG